MTQEQKYVAVLFEADTDKYSDGVNVVAAFDIDQLLHQTVQQFEERGVTGLDYLVVPLNPSLEEALENYGYEEEED